MAARAEPDSVSLDRRWWLNTLVVLQRPRAVFSALRDDSEASAAARQEPMATIAFLAGISLFLATPSAGKVFDDFEYDALIMIVESMFAGALIGLQNYWLGGGALWAGAQGFVGMSSYRQARHLAGYAMAPLVLSLLFVWPVAIAVYGTDLFRTGGSDAGAGRAVFYALWLATVAWGLWLLLLGVRVVYGAGWLRSLGVFAVGAAVLAGPLALAFVV